MLALSSPHPRPPLPTRQLANRQTDDNIPMTSFGLANVSTSNRRGLEDLREVGLENLEDLVGTLQRTRSAATTGQATKGCRRVRTFTLGAKR